MKSNLNDGSFSENIWSFMIYLQFAIIWIVFLFISWRSKCFTQKLWLDIKSGESYNSLKNIKVNTIYLMFGIRSIIWIIDLNVKMIYPKVAAWHRKRWERRLPKPEWLLRELVRSSRCRCTSEETDQKRRTSNPKPKTKE